MSNRPVDKLRGASVMGYGQQAIWEEIRLLKTFTITDIKGVVDMHRTSIVNCVKRLQAGGYVAQADDFNTSYRYHLVKDAGAHIPRINKDGKAVVQGGGTQNMWRSMRMLKVFTPRDLAVHSTTDTVTVEEATAKKYCGMLLKAKYLKVLKKAVPGKYQATYRFVRDTGPKPPQIQRVKQVYDPNLNEVTYYPGGAS